MRLSRAEKKFVRSLLASRQLAHESGHDWRGIQPVLDVGVLGPMIAVPPIVDTQGGDGDIDYGSKLEPGDDDTQDRMPKGPPLLPSPESTATDDAILDVLGKAEVPLKRATIAKRAGLTNNTYVSTRLKHLCDNTPKKVMRWGGDTYWLISRGVPVD